jgi:hypothetical protein
MRTRQSQSEERGGNRHEVTLTHFSVRCLLLCRSISVATPPLSKKRSLLIITLPAHCELFANARGAGGCSLGALCGRQLAAGLPRDARFLRHVVACHLFVVGKKFVRIDFRAYTREGGGG